MADLRRSSHSCPPVGADEALTAKRLGRESSRYPKESGSIFKGTIPFSRAGVSSIRVYKLQVDYALAAARKLGCSGSSRRAKRMEILASSPSPSPRRRRRRSSLHAPMVPYFGAAGAGRSTSRHADADALGGRLTAAGEAQCAALAAAAARAAERRPRRPRRCHALLQAAELAFAERLAAGSPLVALDAAREVSTARRTRGRRRRRRRRLRGSRLCRGGRGGRAVGARRPAGGGGGGGGGAGTNAGGGESDDVDAVHGRCAELWRWLIGRPEGEIALVSDSLLYHMLNFTARAAAERYWRPRRRPAAAAAAAACVAVATPPPRRSSATAPPTPSRRLCARRLAPAR